MLGEIDIDSDRPAAFGDGDRGCSRRSPRCSRHGCARPRVVAKAGPLDGTHHHADSRRRHRPRSHRSGRPDLKVAGARHPVGPPRRRRDGLQAIQPVAPVELLDSIRSNKVALKGPVTTPIGKGFTSVNVGLRKALDLYANLRPVRNSTGVQSRSGRGPGHRPREHRGSYSDSSTKSYQAWSRASRSSPRRPRRAIARFAFEYARAQRPQAGDRDPQGQHHEARRRPVPREHPDVAREYPDIGYDERSSTPRACSW